MTSLPGPAPGPCPDCEACPSEPDDEPNAPCALPSEVLEAPGAMSGPPDPLRPLPVQAEAIGTTSRPRPSFHWFDSIDEGTAWCRTQGIRWLDFRKGRDGHVWFKFYNV